MCLKDKLDLGILDRIVSIFAGIAGSLADITTLAEKYKPYIKRHKKQTDRVQTDKVQTEKNIS